jgi:EpsD family peptidyl-prolyl cis-trans isomerase
MTIRAAVTSARASSLVLIAISCASCLQQESAETTATEPAAIVDGTAISHQSVVAAVPEGDLTQRNAQLDTFISEQLLANAAVRDNIDKDAAVVSALETSRRQTLALAYITTKSKALPKPTSAEIAAFYAEHPELFAQRRIFRLQEIAIQIPPERIANVTERFRDLTTFNDRARWLEQEGLSFTTGVTVKPAEDIPADLLSVLSKLQDGDAFNMPTENGLATVQITGIEDQPLSLEQAKSFIEQYLNNQRLGEMINQETRRLRESAVIEYIRPYSAVNK